MKTINNKQYNECSVVMLATNKVDNCLILRGSKLEIHKQYFTQSYLKNLGLKSYHLYILSDEEIKEGDWFLSNINEVLQCTKREDKFIWYERLTVPGVSKVAQPFGIHINLNSKKIIATTDKSLKITKDLGEISIENILPQIPQSFIDYFVEQYNKGNAIDKVLVEYKLNTKDFDDIIEKVWNDDYKLIINPDNTINILPTKDSWNRNEVENILLKLMREQIKFPSYNSYEMEEWYNQWISKNL